MSRSSTSRCRWWRRWSLAALLCFLVAHVLAAAHEAHTVHVRCAEHGELVDIDAIGTTPGSGPSAAHLQIAPPEAGGDDHAAHEHCAFAPLGHCSVVPAVAAPPCASPPVGPLASAPSVACFAISGIALLALAPKTSPPA